MTHGSPRGIYTCILIDAAGNPISTSSEEFPSEDDAIKSAANALFAIDGAAGYELWHNGRKVARFMKPGPG